MADNRANYPVTNPGTRHPRFMTRRSHLRLFLKLSMASVFLCMLETPAIAQATPTVRSRAAILVSADTGEVLLTHNADVRQPVASTQKLMTALLLVERGGLGEMMTIDRSDTLVAPTKLGLQAGHQYRRIDLMRALLVRSGNDVAHALGRDHSGSEAAFAEAMTARARRLGMVNSKFGNASGLPEPSQYSTARDMARLALYITRTQKCAPIRETVKMQEFNFQFNNGKTTRLVNTNRLLQRLPGCNGMKTGYTNASGRCLVSSATRNGRTVIAVVLGASGDMIWTDSQNLLNWGLEH